MIGRFRAIIGNHYQNGLHCGFLLQVLHIDFVAFNKPSTSTDGAAKRGHSGNIADGSNNDAKKLSDHAWHKNGQVRIGRFKLIF